MILVSLVMLSCRGEQEAVSLTISGHEFHVELAVSPEERQQGLMNRQAIDERGGMLFVFPQSEPRSFWMRNTSIPLSIAYIAPNGVIQEIYDMEPFSLERVESRLPAQFALEVRQGTFKELGIEPGDRVLFPDEVIRLARSHPDQQ